MSMIGKFKNLVFGEDEDFDDTYDDVKEEEVQEDENEFEPIIKQKGNRVVNIHNNSSTKIMVIKPTAYDEAEQIAQAIRNRKIVVINANVLETKITQRIIDFISGACYVLGADIQEIDLRIYLIAPSNIEVTNELKSEIASKALFNWNK